MAWSVHLVDTYARLTDIDVILQLWRLDHRKLSGFLLLAEI